MEHKYDLWELQYDRIESKLFIKCVEKQSQEQLHQTIESSFNSVFKTILHIWDAEYIWLQRMQGNSLKDWPSKMMDKEGFSTNLFLASAANFNDFVNSADDAFFEKSCEYSNLKGEKFAMPYASVVMHCMNHGTYHRGQLVTMFRQLGLTEIPSTDIIAFERKQ